MYHSLSWLKRPIAAGYQQIRAVDADKAATYNVELDGQLSAYEVVNLAELQELPI